MKALAYRVWLTFVHIYVLLMTAIFSTWSIMLFLFDSSGRATHFYGAQPWARVLLWGCRVKAELEGMENLPSPDRTEPLVLVCNHTSMFDILALLARLPVDFKFVVKAELGKVPLWGYAMKKAGYIFVQRGSGGQAGVLMRQAVERIKGGSAVLFFAEGTRSADGRLGEFKRGAFVLASQAGADVLPIAIEGAASVLAPKSFQIHPGHITVRVLPVVDDPAVKKSSRKLMAEVHQVLSDSLEHERLAA
ncbi:MAG: 1-acyl-sn-glycerol-3-phosphate acyltransferase [Desulfarculaceae bacterium]|nr:1-acyl-sn-glycerol-3-phosphate acyltransferase [Desulfarculaceae bacterium]MCF8073765.1 1-acyl-sn-glycerol-3-phosphate acyltransferase [Desulfarculaceae bacterium]MCF8102006.1 1-acyl-sn-glycerol-3-phosphate acyltransferase [Desulfarculaceae bacterium]MCF8115976.1 1-acyl-sn-glycerol-3-phosphate acyltransferase [Desulfarculaceae bacterium]